MGERVRVTGAGAPLLTRRRAVDFVRVAGCLCQG
jgi:hypothetical protein